MREPDDGDVSFCAAAIAARVAEMAEDRRAGVFFVLALDPESVRKKGVAPGGIDQEPGTPCLDGAVLKFQRDNGVLILHKVAKFDCCHPCAFVDSGTLVRRIAQQHVIEF